MFFNKSNTLKRGTEIYPYVIEDAMPQGRGGMAQIYIAHKKSDTKKVALKISKGADPTYVEALRSEVIILQKLSNPKNHPHIVSILPLPLNSKHEHHMACAYNIPSRPWYYAMEYLSGFPLSSYVRGGKGLPEQLTLIIIAKISSALAHVHEHGIAHLDIKTENIVMRFPLKNGNIVAPVLIDFGVAANTKEVQTDAGSLAFMPPERLQQVQRRVAPESVMVMPDKVDIYGLGVSFFEMMTGRLPFGGLTKSGLTTAIIKHQMSRPRDIRSDITERTEKLILAMLDIDPCKRPSFEEIISFIGEQGNPVKLISDVPCNHRS